MVVAMVVTSTDTACRLLLMLLVLVFARPKPQAPLLPAWFMRWCIVD